MAAMSLPARWALPSRDPLPHFAQGRVCRPGDAAHPTPPFLAQGANMALENAVVVARCLDAFAVPDALRHFEAARPDRTAAIVRGSVNNTQWFHNPARGDPLGAADHIDREFVPETIQQRYDWLDEYDALTMPM
jgi:salicylate hydroxylase